LKNTFIDKIKTLNAMLIKPKFKVGDFIECKKFKTIAKVEQVLFSINNNYKNPKTGDRLNTFDIGLYRLIYIKNPMRLEAMKNRGITAQFSNGRLKVIRNIDLGYELIESEAARILYDSILQGGDQCQK